MTLSFNDFKMTKHLYDIAHVLVGNYDLAVVWAGLFSSAISALLTLRAYFGFRFLDIVRLRDVFYWLIGVFIFMRSGMLIIRLSGIDFLQWDYSIDAVSIGFISGALNVYLFKNNYKPILGLFKTIEKYFN